MEAKQYDTKQPIDHWRNQRGNQKIPRGKWKWKHDDPKPMGFRGGRGGGMNWEIGLDMYTLLSIK